MDTAMFTLRLLGGFRLATDSGEQIGISAKKSRALFAYLALAPKGVASRDRLAGLLWSDTDLQFAKTNLRQCLSALRKQINNKSTALIHNDGDQLQLYLKKLKIDALHLSALDVAGATATLAKTAELNGGILLPDFPPVDSEFDGWLGNERTILSDRYCRALEKFLEPCESHLPTDRVNVNEVEKLAKEILAVESTNEKAHLWLVKHYLKNADRSAAIRQYQTCQSAMATQLDVEPGPELSSLYESMRQPVESDTDVSPNVKMAGTPHRNPAGVSPQHEVSSLDTLATTTSDRKPGLTKFTLPACILAAVLVMALLSIYGKTALKAARSTAAVVPTYSEKHDILEFLPPHAQYSIAVIPFRNLSDDPGQLYLSDGLSEDLVTEISRISGLNVIIRQSSFLFRDAENDLETLRQSLPVDYILSGSVRRMNDEIRINAHLVHLPDATYVWSDKFDGSMDDILRTQDKITRRIVASLLVELTESEWQRLSENREVSTEAYDFLLRGLHPFSQFTEEGVGATRDYFRRAIAADSGYARPYANMVRIPAKLITCSGPR